MISFFSALPSNARFTVWFAITSFSSSSLDMSAEISISSRIKQNPEYKPYESKNI